MQANRAFTVIIVVIAITLAILLMLPGGSRPNPGSIAASTATSPPLVAVNITSDPAGATVYVTGIKQGPTPVTVQVPQGTPTNYQVMAESNVPNHELYHPFSGILNVSEPENISVWPTRLNADEVAALEHLKEAERRQACWREGERVPLVVDNWRWSRAAGDYNIVIIPRTDRLARDILAGLAIVSELMAAGLTAHRSDFSAKD